MKKFKLSEYNDQIKDWSVYEKLGLPMAVKAKCMDCCCYDRKEVKLSPCKSCPLYIFKEIYFNSRKYEDILNDYTEKED